MIKYPKIPVAQTLILSCLKFDFFDVVISPGSRNVPLAIGFASNKKFKCYSIVDERSAAFFALGLSQKSKKPTILIRFLEGVLKSQIQPERSTHSPTEVKETLN